MTKKKMGRPRTRAKPNRFDREVGARIKAAREKAGLSPTQAAIQVKKHLSTLMRWEAGDVCVPINMLAWLAKIYGCQMQDFLDGVRPR
jgi:ribosome-binding protein aMBF1 (putative translation factor)